MTKPKAAHLLKRCRPGEAVAFLERGVFATTNDCVLWPFNRTKGGYPMVGVARKMTPATRIVCERVHGPAPDPRMDAAHSCDTPPCINGRHLSWKTRRANMIECVERGRHARCGNGGWRRAPG